MPIYVAGILHMCAESMQGTHLERGYTPIRRGYRILMCPFFELRKIKIKRKRLWYEGDTAGIVWGCYHDQVLDPKPIGRLTWAAWYQCLVADRQNTPYVRVLSPSSVSSCDLPISPRRQQRHDAASRSKSPWLHPSTCISILHASSIAARLAG